LLQNNCYGAKTIIFASSLINTKLHIFHCKTEGCGKLGNFIYNICDKFRHNSVAKQLLTVQKQRLFASLFANIAIIEKYNSCFFGKLQVCCEPGKHN